MANRLSEHFQPRLLLVSYASKPKAMRICQNAVSLVLGLFENT